MGYGFFGVKVFNGYSLGLHFCDNIIKKMVISWTINIRVLDHDIRFQAKISFYVDNFLHYLFKVNGFSVLLLHLNFNKRLETFLKIADYSKLIKSSDKINLHQDRLKLLKLKRSVFGLF